MTLSPSLKKKVKKYNISTHRTKTFNFNLLTSFTVKDLQNFVNSIPHNNKVYVEYEIHYDSLDMCLLEYSIREEKTEEELLEEIKSKETYSKLAREQAILTIKDLEQKIEDIKNLYKL